MPTPEEQAVFYRRRMVEVLVVEDDPTVSEVVSSYLAEAGYEVRTAVTVAAAVEAAARTVPDAVVLDVMLLDGDGLELGARLRKDTGCAVIVLSALGTPMDRIAGLEIGADDYLGKPFSPRELLLRLAAVLRRRAPPEGAPLQVGTLRLEPHSRSARRDDVELSLTAREFDLLAHFVAHPGQVFTREELMRDVWGWTAGEASTVTGAVRRLRDKVERDPVTPEMIVTVWGVGYRLDIPAPAVPMPR